MRWLVGDKKFAALFLLVFKLTCCCQTTASSSARSVDSAYDTSKGVFSPQGRLVQLDYVEGIVQRGNLCMGAECKDGVVLVTNKVVSSDLAKLMEGASRRIYKVDSHIAILPAGLPADGRALAQKAMEYCRAHRREFGEPMPGRVLADRLGEFMHAACVRWGSRAYASAVFVACWDGDDEVGDGHGSVGSAVPLDVETAEPTDADATAPAAHEETPPANTGASSCDAASSVACAPDGNEEEKEAEEGAPRARGQESGTGQGKAIDERGSAAGKGLSHQLYLVDPSGTSRRYRAACVGAGSSRVRKWLHRRADLAAPPGGASDGGAPSSVAVVGREGDEGTESRRRRRPSARLVSRPSIGGGSTSSSSSCSSESSSDGAARGENARAVVVDTEKDEGGQEEEEERGLGPPNDAVDDGAERRRRRSGDRSRKARRGQEHRRHRQHKRRRQRQRQSLPLSMMTCEDAARVMVEEAGRADDGQPGPPGLSGRAAVGETAVASAAEVAWVSLIPRGEGDRTSRAYPHVVHLRSVEDLLQKTEAVHGGEGGVGDHRR